MALDFHPPSWVTGGISTGDAEFLAALIAQVQPELVVEVGVAAGTSSAAILQALDQLPGRRVLMSVDLARSCYFDHTRLVGSAVQEMYPQHQALWILEAGSTARRVGAAGKTAIAAPYDLAFIDADHRHPWPLLDLLHLAPSMRPEAWIVLHDVALARLYPEFQCHGAEWLYGAWPWAKSLGTGDAENIGAIQLPADLSTLIPVALALLRPSWEARILVSEVELAPVFAAITTILQTRLLR